MQRIILSMGLAVVFAFAACSDDSGTTPKTDKGVTVDHGTAGDSAKSPADQGLDQAPRGKVEDYVPADGAVKGWQRDGAMETAYTAKARNDLINSSNDPYEKEGTVGLVRQVYVNGELKMVLTMWEMNTAVGAKNMYDKNVSDPGLTFEKLEVQDGASIAESAPQWKAYGHKGLYVYKVMGTFTMNENKSTLKTDETAFITHLAGILP